MSDSSQSFLLGADPEFAILNPKVLMAKEDKNLDRFIYPSNFPDLHENRYGSVLGADGCGRIFEIRPEPHCDPEVIVNRIKEILQSFLNVNPNIKDYALLANASIKHNKDENSSVDTLGGHIHFGGDNVTSKVPFYPSICSAMSVFIGIPILLVENWYEARARRMNYGRPFDYRAQNYGIEFRMPSSWLFSPHTAIAALALAKIVGQEIFIDNKIFNSLSFDVQSFTTFNNQAYETMIRKVNRKQLISIFEKIWPMIQQMSLYDKYKHYVELFPYLISNSLCWNANKDMKIMWNLNYVKKQVRKETLKTIFDRYAKLIPQTA